MLKKFDEINGNYKIREDVLYFYLIEVKSLSKFSLKVFLFRAVLCAILLAKEIQRKYKVWKKMRRKKITSWKYMKHYRIIAGNTAPISKTSEGDIIALVTSMLLFYFSQLLFYAQLEW